MHLAALQQWEIKLISAGVSAGVGAVVYLVVQRARKVEKGAKDISQVKRAGEVIAAAPVAVNALVIVMLVVLGFLLHLPWWTAVFLLPLLAWCAWWLPVSRRCVTTEGSILVNGLPARVSAFVADVPGQARWSPGAVSYTPAIQGPRGPRFNGIERTPEGREVAGVLELTRDDPGVEVDILLAGAGVSGGYYSFAARDGGTLVTKRSVFEMPYVLALAGGMFALRGDPTGSHQRLVTELNALKAAFESGQ